MSLQPWKSLSIPRQRPPCVEVRSQVDLANGTGDFNRIGLRAELRQPDLVADQSVEMTLEARDAALRTAPGPRWSLPLDSQTQ
jgi:hypothetical protein